MTSPDPLPPALATLELETGGETTRAYAELTADPNPIHTDAGYAAKTGFGRPILHGTMALNLILEAAARTFGRDRPVRDLQIRFVKPVPVGAVIRAAGTLADRRSGAYTVFVETDSGLRALEGTLTVAP